MASLSTEPRTHRSLRLAEKAILGVIAGAAAAVGVTEIVFAVGRILRLALDPVITVAGIPLVDAAAEAFTSASARVTAATYDSVTLSVEGAPELSRGLLIGETILGSLLTVGICAVLAWLCLRVFVGRPFVRSATWGIGIVAILVIAAGLGGALLNSIAVAEIVEALGLTAAGAPIFLVGVDLAPLGWAFALIVVAGAFELGQRMQRDTTGLV